MNKFELMDYGIELLLGVRFVVLIFETYKDNACKKLDIVEVTTKTTWGFAWPPWEKDKVFSKCIVSFGG